MNELIEGKEYILNKNVNLTDQEIILPKGKIVKINHIDTDNYITLETFLNGEKVIFNTLKKFFLSEIPENYKEPTIEDDKNINFEKGSYIENNREVFSMNGDVYFKGHKFILTEQKPEEIIVITKDAFNNYVTLNFSDKNAFILSKNLKEDNLKQWDISLQDLKERDILQNIKYVIELKKEDFQVIVKVKNLSDQAMVISEEKDKDNLYFDLVSVLDENSIFITEEKNQLIKMFCDYIYTKQDCFVNFKNYLDLKNNLNYSNESKHTSFRKKAM